MKLTNIATRIAFTGALIALACQAQTQPAPPPGSSPAGVPALAAKPPGVVRIGIAPPSVQFGPAPSAGYGPSITQLFENYLKGPHTEVVALTTMLPQQVETEAAQQHCDYLLYSSLSQKQGSGPNFLKGASTLAGFIPMGGVARGLATVVTTANTASNIALASGLSGMIKAKSQLSLDYKVVPLGYVSPIAANTLKQKATQDGQDIITPLITQASAEILSHTQTSSTPPVLK